MWPVSHLGNVSSPSIASPTVLSTGRVCQLIPILGNWQPAPAPIFHLDLLDDDEGGLEWLIEDIEKRK